MPKNGSAHLNRKARAQAAKKLDDNGRAERRALVESTPSVGKPHKWGQRAKLLISARRAVVAGQMAESGMFMEQAAQLAPLTEHELRRTQRRVGN